MDYTVGIDLGTTNSCVAIFKNNIVEIIENEAGFYVTPSWVTFTDNVVLTGTEAVEVAHMYPKTSVYESKRLIGQSFDDPKVQKDIATFSYPVIEDLGAPRIQIEVDNAAPKLYYPEEIGAYILERMKKIADERLQADVRRAVVTVPAYFNDTQRQATIDAGKVAGFDVINIINEPTAAALAFDHHHKKPYSRNILVYDFGGGTFNVTIVSIGRGKCQVRATDGDTHLGGTDIDTNLVDLVVADYKSKFKTEMRMDESAIRRMKSICEKAKKTLSGGQNHVNVELLALFGEDHNLQVSKAKFEAINGKLFKRTMDIVERCLKASGLAAGEVDEVVLVGGSTRIPKVRQLLYDYFGEEKINKGVNPDEAVAQGAAIHAFQLVGDKNEVKDVTSLSLGTNTYGDRMSVIIPRNTPIPTRAVKRYQTMKDDQTEMEFPIFQGEEEIASDNHELGQFAMVGLTPGPARSVAVEICLEMNAEGILHVSAFEINSDKEKNQIEVDIKKKGLNEEQIQARIEELERNKRQRQTQKGFDDVKYRLETLIHKLEEYGRDCGGGDDEKRAIAEKCDRYHRLLDTVKIEGANEIEDAIKEISELLDGKSNRKFEE